jgi:7-cyano-7-deazaguanine reductase
MSESFVPDSAPLGKQSDHVEVYTPSLLVGIPRSGTRQHLGINEQNLPFSGLDVWNGYELSWLNAKGKPVVAIARFDIPCSSSCIVESKSFKLYLNSLNQTTFNSVQEVVKTIEADLSLTVQAPVLVQIHLMDPSYRAEQGSFPGTCLDGLDVQVQHYSPNPKLLSADQGQTAVFETLYSHLLRSSCPVTGQPDWGSVMIRYRGRPIDREGLLKYIISYRNHQEFHEQCIERMFMDILDRCEPEMLSIDGRYVRRGGLDINPFRSNCGESPQALRLARQ